MPRLTFEYKVTVANVIQIAILLLGGLGMWFTLVGSVAKTSDDKKKPGELHAYEVLRRHKVICDLGAVEWLEEKLGGAIFHEQAGLAELAESLEEQQTEAAQPAEQSQPEIEPTPAAPSSSPQAAPTA